MKTCFKCNAHLPLESFYKHPQMADGHLNKCKKCARSDTRENRIKRADHYRAYDAKRLQEDPRVRERHKRYQASDRGKEILTASRKRWQKKNPHKRKAHHAVNNALRDGILVKPPECQVCQKPHSKIHGHHDNYSKPLEVVWCCPKCHHAIHKRLEAQGLNPD